MTRDERDVIVRNLESRMSSEEQSAYYNFCVNKSLQTLDPDSTEFQDILASVSSDPEVSALMEMGFHNFLDNVVDRIYQDIQSY